MWNLWSMCSTYISDPKTKRRHYSIEWPAFIAARLENHPAFEVPGEAQGAMCLIREVLNTPPDRRDRLMS